MNIDLENFSSFLRAHLKEQGFLLLLILVLYLYIYEEILPNIGPHTSLTRCY